MRRNTAIKGDVFFGGGGGYTGLRVDNGRDNKQREVRCAISLRACYAIPGTDVAYGATCLRVLSYQPTCVLCDARYCPVLTESTGLWLSAYALARRCPVLTWHMTLCYRPTEWIARMLCAASVLYCSAIRAVRLYWRSGWHGATRCVCTDVAYGATRCICTDVAYGATRCVCTDGAYGATVGAYRRSSDGKPRP
eukprot:3246461-Rhodomonas_salina.2